MNTKLSPELIERLRQAADAAGTSLEREVQAHLQRRKDVKRAAMARIDRRRATLPDVTAKEVMAWIRSHRRRDTLPRTISPEA